MTCRATAVRTLLAAILVLAPRAVATAAGEGATERLTNDRCPVTPDEFSSPLYELTYRGATVRFCCADCRDDFRKDPAPYLTHLPQLSLQPDAEAGFAASSGREARAERVDVWLDRWMRPTLIALIALLAVWLVVRHTRRPPAPAAAGAGSSRRDE